jgi:hypothetical protein
VTPLQLLMLIATNGRILRVTNGRRVEVLYGNRHGFWAANSLVKDRDGTLYLGARYIVVRLRPEQWATRRRGWHPKAQPVRAPRLTLPP